MQQESPCLSDELLAELVDGRLDSDELARVHRHTAECAACRALLAAMVRGGIGGAAPSPPEVASEPPNADWTPPAEFDEFRLVRLLGRGAMGVVYLAHDRTLERQVAVKFIAAPQPDTRAREHFQTEARAIARLQHPNVVTVFRVGEVEGHPYLVSEYLLGQSLAELPLPVPWRRALSLGVGLARGLAAAHRHGVLHRDLKPSNILLTAEGEVKLLDFGLAELVEVGTPASPGGVPTTAGTPRYMAPELFRGASATPRSDLYSLGLVLYELCTGVLPKKEERRGLTLSTLVPGIDLDFAALLERCLQANADERPASAEALRTALERLERRHEAEGLSAGNPYRGLAPFEAEHRGLFFGRDADIHAVLERLRRQPLVLVAGDSGVGKSSLCRAGVLPRIAHGALDEYRDFSTLTLEPGRRPLAALASVLAPVLGPVLGRAEAELGVWLAEGQGALGPMLRAACGQERGLLLFVDQFEELLTLSEPAQAARFASLLGELALPNPGVRVLLTVRGDFLTRLGALPGLGGEVERALYLLRPLAPESVREAITGPARSRGVSFESEELLQTLTKAAAQGMGSLPLLQFALAELWERRDQARGLMTRAALEEMGGVAGALSRHADGVLARLTRAQQQAAHHLLSRLVTAERTRGERSEEELTAGSAEARAALQALVAGRLVHARTTAGLGSYEIAHEALISSWETLRNWLEEDTSQRVLRRRLRALGRWVAAALLLVLASAASYGGLRLLEYRDTQRFIAARLEAARAALESFRGLRQRASASRQEALALFDGTGGSGNLWAQAEQVWSRALEEFAQANAASTEAERALEEALERDRESLVVRELLIGLTYERLLLAERFHRGEERTRLLQRFERLTAGGGEWRARLQSPGGLELTTEPPGASVELLRYVEERGVRRRRPVSGAGTLGKTPLGRLTLPAGSYHLRLKREGHAPVELPLLLERGGLERLHLTLPTSVPEGYVYIPPGCFLSGSADPERLRRFFRSAPMHRLCLREGYLIGRTEVTLGDWLQYLDTLPAEAPARRLLETPRFGTGGALALKWLPQGPWSLSLHLMGGQVLTALAGEPIRYPGRSHHREQDWRHFPLAGVSAEDVAGYLAWLDHSGRLRGARLCTEHEWTRAARGADDREYPHGDRLLKDEANIDMTYDRQPQSLGPDEVGTHLASTSPFGVSDMAGNVLELTQAVPPDPGRSLLLRGGAWSYDESAALIANRQPFPAQQRDARVGLRVCAPAP